MSWAPATGPHAKCLPPGPERPSDGVQGGQLPPSSALFTLVTSYVQFISLGLGYLDLLGFLSALVISFIPSIMYLLACVSVVYNLFFYCLIPPVSYRS
ncbi:hypothetical protein PGT21_024245 [Puccinia graminis f. sp. tritici]|uniref:Uncharacterized protein n=1 Tax=Puccinia graminis f. sp. tritici TaxID=56615 RepID=A0A5B0MVH7_PUCGR|nr:hypothetical protein PGT21_024245 [Puccinia graminis f. sp. tritici]KAA1137021.1 hypothetical protein PGTUg99_007751 [Puccinia graminis f. sp. tritici]